MPHVIISPIALRDIERLREFLRQKHPEAAARAAQAIIKTLLTLEQHPQIGRPVEGSIGAMRELLIPFGRNGYVARYVYEGADVEIVAIRHMLEAGFYTSL